MVICRYNDHILILYNKNIYEEKENLNYKTTIKSFFYLYTKTGDYMKVYLEYIFLINLLLDLMILFGTKRLLKRNISNYRLLLGSIFGSLSTFIVYIKILIIPIKIILGIGIILITFGKKNFLENTFYFYLISIILGGIIYLFDIKDNIIFYNIILIIGSPILIYLIVKELLHLKNNISNNYQVDIYLKNKKYSLTGFIDTGNRLTSPIKKESVILVNLKINSNKIIYVPYKALNTSGIIPCIRPDKVIINKKIFNNCLIGLAKDKFIINGLDCILPNKFKEELW